MDELNHYWLQKWIIKVRNNSVENILLVFFHPKGNFVESRDDFGK